MSSPLRSCEEDEGMVVNSEGGDFDEEDDDDDGDLDGNASDINSPAAPRETATAAAPGTVREKEEEKVADKSHQQEEKHKFVEQKKGVACLEVAAKSVLFQVRSGAAESGGDRWVCARKNPS